MEQPFELGESGSKSYLDQEAPTSISRGSSPSNITLTKKREEVKWLKFKKIGMMAYT